jgi:hypothetical protein
VYECLGGGETDASLPQGVAELGEGAGVDAVVRGVLPVRWEGQVLGESLGNGRVALDSEVQREGGGKASFIIEGAEVDTVADDLEEDAAVGELHDGG